MTDTTTHLEVTHKLIAATPLSHGGSLGYDHARSVLAWLEAHGMHVTPKPDDMPQAPAATHTTPQAQTGHVPAGAGHPFEPSGSGA